MKYILIILIVLILVPVIKQMIQNNDYKRQIEGKRPERTLADSQRMPWETLSKADQAQIGACGDVTAKAEMDARVTAFTNLAGPH